MSLATTELPRYKCHKEVWALKIRDLVPQLSETVFGSEDASLDGATIYPNDPRYAPFYVDQAYIEKHKPEIGGYYVVYKDGYKSYSPADAFEGGYSLIA